ncbi:hypothetical protein M409DRAFT_51352 [Zasmidium cellare ATCC 36951]|uniref:Fucose-specific lectin n=1 Tax=Zasmidium cellare ATCC 36951 TaxID=1080233 RepID=A0A6A6CZ99_ZASCE|nr:uncharacterized protein M409DRAFT_51352 [Zasmidium cellare ATCC 36951]KAF2171139.1 hypothetical protein M409DRAFT_51352 [Zasmidium cellare ATCC 36951]
MASNVNRDAEGLQAVEQNNYPEVVPGQQQLRNPLERQSSLSRPEAYSPPQPQGNEKPNGYGHDGYGSYTAVSQGHSDHQSLAPPQYGQDYPSKQLESQEKPAERRILGMRKKVFIWVAAIVAIIVVLAVVLGAVLGTVLPDDDKSSNNPQNSGSGSANNSSSSNATNSAFLAKDKTGMAMLSPAGQSSQFAYYVDDSGAIIEVEYPNGNWNQNQDAPPKTTNITSIGSGSDTPIAAIAYTLQGDTHYRQIFYFDNNGVVSTANTTGNGNWSTPYQPVTDQSSLPSTMSLAACADTTSNALNGIRVYFGSSNNLIQEIGMDFSESSGDPIWHVWANFPGSDASAGVGCAIINNHNHMYLRNSSTSRLQQWTWDYINVSTWMIGANSSADNGVAEGGSIAVTSDGQNTDYIFYQDTAKQTALAEYSGSGAAIADPMTTVESISAAPLGYSLAATWANGAVVMNQNSTTPGDLLFSSVSRNGDAQSYTTQTGGSS